MNIGNEKNSCLSTQHQIQLNILEKQIISYNSKRVVHVCKKV